MSNQNIENSIKRISDEILTHLLAYREQHPNFTFRPRTSNKEERLSKGYWFQGSDYIFVALYNQGDSNNRTKTIGFVISFDKDGNVKDNFIEIVFSTVDEQLKPFYFEIIRRLGVDVKQDVFKYAIPYPDKSYIKNLNTYITSQKAIIDTALTEFGLDTHKRFKPSNEEFTEWLNNIQAIRKTLYSNETTISNMKKFEAVITELKQSLPNAGSKLAQFQVGKSGKDGKDSWLWVKDHLNIIGTEEAHYEIRAINNSKIVVDIHFEKKSEMIKFHTAFGEALPNRIKWIDWFEAKSLRYEEEFDINSPILIEDIKKALLYLDDNIGDKVRSIMRKNFNNLTPLNQILFGPPGTGKTYHTINKALAIIENKAEVELEKEERKALKERFEKHVESGQIVFTTFHQSMSYEDFIEGIKPLKPESAKNIQYDIVDGVFKKIANKAFYSLLPLESKQVNSEMPSFETLYSEFLSTLNKETIFKTISDYELKLIELKGTSIIVMFKWQNTAKTIPATQPFSITKEKIKQLFEAGLNPHDVKNLKLSFEPYFKHNLSVYYAVYRKFYEFVEKKVGDTTIQQIESSDTFGYEESKERWLLIDESQQKELISKSDNYVLIIDEINRGNVSQIFGELITLIEEDKRLGKGEALEVMLPYSKEKFGVPPNLYIIGTMNTADRSVEALDTALRRRFSFVEMPPKPDLIKTEGKLKSSEGIIGDINLVTVLKTINDRIEVLLNRDNLIGHSYFLNVDSEKALKETFFKNIIPLLQEYFFGDYGKIGLILGEGFIRIKRNENSKQVKFAKFSYDDTEGLHKRVYEIIPQAEIDIEAAINLLLHE